MACESGAAVDDGVQCRVFLTPHSSFILTVHTAQPPSSQRRRPQRLYGEGAGPTVSSQRLAWQLLAAAVMLSSTRDKRTRSWDVGAALDELVEWDALEEFMQDMPDHAAMPLQGEPSLGGVGSVESSAMSSGFMRGPIPARPHKAPRGGTDGAAATMSTTAAAAVRPVAPAGWLAQGFDAGGASSSFGGGGLMCGAPNAAALAQSLYSGWQQGPSAFPLQALPMERGVSWGAELLPLIEDHTDNGLMVSAVLGNHSPIAAELGQPAQACMMDGGASSSAGLEDAAGRSVHKQRFVWTQELHCRFEAAVNTLGIDLAKPQVRARSKLASNNTASIREPQHAEPKSLLRLWCMPTCAHASARRPLRS